MSYGTEIWCINGIQTGRFARGPMVVIQALFRRITTPRGMLRGGDEEAAYGVDISEYIGAAGPETAAASLPGIVRGEFLKDDRVADVEVTATLSEDTARAATITLEVRGVLHDSEEEFAFTVAASAVTTTLLGVAA